jgi:hypothetical protein
MNQYPLLAYISLFSVILPIGIGIPRIKILHLGMTILLLYLVFSFAADIYLIWFASGYQFALGLFHVYYLVEYIFIMSIITVWQESLKMKRLFQALILIYILFWIIAKVTFEPLNGLYSFVAGTSQILLLIGAEITLFIIIRDRMQPIINHYRFWVLLSFVIYYTGTLLIIISRGILLHYSISILFLIQSIDWSLKILFNILFAVGFLCPQTQT